MGKQLIDEKINHEIQENLKGQLDALDNYTDLLIKAELFKKNNAQVFADWEQLTNELEAAEADLKDFARSTGEDMENDTVKVTVSEKWKKYYDYNAVLVFANEQELATLKKFNGIKNEIDKLIMDECVANGLIRPEVKQESFREEMLTTAIIIKSKIK